MTLHNNYSPRLIFGQNVGLSMTSLDNNWSQDNKEAQIRKKGQNVKIPTLSRDKLSTCSQGDTAMPSFQNFTGKTFSGFCSSKTIIFLSKL